MVESDNPAGRLWNFLNNIAQRPNKGDVSIRQAIAEIVRVDPDNNAEVLGRMASVYELPARIRADVDKLALDGTELVSELSQLENALFAMDTRGPVSGWTPHLSPTAMLQLKIASSLLHQQLPERTASRDKVEDLGVKIDELITDVRSSDLPPDVGGFLLDHLYEMRRAVDLFDIAGLEGFARAFERTIGGLVTHDKLAERGQKDDPSVWAKFGVVLGGIALLFTTANQGTELMRSWFPELRSTTDSPDGAEDSPSATVVIEVDSGSATQGKVVSP